MIDFEKDRILDGTNVREAVLLAVRNHSDESWLEAVVQYIEERERKIKRSMFKGRYKSAIEEFARQEMKK